MKTREEVDKFLAKKSTLLNPDGTLFYRSSGSMEGEMFESIIEYYRHTLFVENIELNPRNTNDKYYPVSFPPEAVVSFMGKAPFNMLVEIFPENGALNFFKEARLQIASNIKDTKIFCKGHIELLYPKEETKGVAKRVSNSTIASDSFAIPLENGVIFENSHVSSRYISNLFLSLSEGLTIDFDVLKSLAIEEMARAGYLKRCRVETVPHYGFKVTVEPYLGRELNTPLYIVKWLTDNAPKGRLQKYLTKGKDSLAQEVYEYEWSKDIKRMLVERDFN